MLPIDIELIRHIVSTLNHIHAGLDQHHLVVAPYDEELAEQARRVLIENLSTLVEAIEMAVLCQIVEGLTSSEEATTPTVDNVVIFPNVTPEA